MASPDHMGRIYAVLLGSKIPISYAAAAQITGVDVQTTIADLYELESLGLAKSVCLRDGLVLWYALVGDDGEWSSAN